MRQRAIGLLTLGVGNTCLSFAELLVPSGIAALLVTTAPFWMVGLEALLPGGAPLHCRPFWRCWWAARAWRCWRYRLFAHPEAGSLGIVPGFLLLQLSCAAWCLGSLLQRRQASRAHPFVSGAVQQFVTGLVFVVPAWLDPHKAHWTMRAWEAVLYLALFGSVVGYSAYLYAIQHLPSRHRFRLHLHQSAGGGGIGMGGLPRGVRKMGECFGGGDFSRRVSGEAGAAAEQDWRRLIAIEEFGADGAAESRQRSQEEEGKDQSRDDSRPGSGKFRSSG